MSLFERITIKLKNNKDVIPYLGVVLTFSFTAINYFIDYGIRDYYRIPPSIKTTINSPYIRILMLLSSYILLTLFLYIYIELRNYVNRIIFCINYKPLIIGLLFLFKFLCYALGSYLSFLIVSLISSSFTGISNQAISLKIYRVDILISMALFVALVFTGLDYYKISDKREKKTKNNNTKPVKNIEENTSNIEFYVLMIIFLMLASFASGFFVDLGRSIAKSIDCYGVVKINNDPYAILNKVDNNYYICKKIESIRGEEGKDKNSDFIIIDINSFNRYHFLI